MSHDLISFEEQVIERSHLVPVVVDFWANWCGPCLMFSPILEKAVSEAGGTWDLVKVNTEEHPEISAQHRIQSLPTLKLFIDGKSGAESPGVLAEPQLKRWISQYIPSPFAAELAAAEASLSTGDFARALEKVAVVLSSDPGNEDALFLRVKATLATAPAEVGAAMNAIPARSPYFDRASSLREIAQLLTHPPEMPPGELATLCAEGLHAMQVLNFTAACEALLSVIERDKEFGGDIASRSLKQIFLYLGPRSDVTEKYQRRFASLLFS